MKRDNPKPEPANTATTSTTREKPRRKTDLVSRYDELLERAMQRRKYEKRFGRPE